SYAITNGRAICINSQRFASFFIQNRLVVYRDRPNTMIGSNAISDFDCMTVKQKLVMIAFHGSFAIDTNFIRFGKRRIDLLGTPGSVDREGQWEISKWTPLKLSIGVQADYITDAEDSLPCGTHPRLVCRWFRPCNIDWQHTCRHNAHKRQRNHIEDDEGEKQWTARCLLAWQSPKDQAEGDTDELHQEQREDQLDATEAKFCPVDRRDTDDRANRIVIDEKGYQVLEKFAVVLNVFECITQSAQADANDGFPRFQFFGCRRRFGNIPENWNGEHRPPDCHTQKRQTWSPRTGQHEDHDSVDRQQNTAAKIAHRVATCRNAILIFRFGDVRQQGIVKGVGGS